MASSTARAFIKCVLDFASVWTPGQGQSPNYQAYTMSRSTALAIAPTPGLQHCGTLVERTHDYADPERTRQNLSS